MLAVNRRMSYVVAMNMDNADTSITRFFFFFILANNINVIISGTTAIVRARFAPWATNNRERLNGVTRTAYVTVQQFRIKCFFTAKIIPGEILWIFL